MEQLPLVTNAFPLYRSKRFVEIIIQNIETIDYPNTEIIISDRHQYDDAIKILENYFAHDNRVTVIKAHDELNYSQHYNLLLKLGKGKYFRWMPHDDSYPRCCLREKVKILEQHPQIVLVNGPWREIHQDGRVSELRFPRKSPLRRWSYESSIFMAFGDYEWNAFKGLFRREAAIENNIWLYDTQWIIRPETCWEFAMTLMGEFHSFPEFAYVKRFYAGSTQDTWLKNRRPIDMVMSTLYKWKDHCRLDRKPLRMLVFSIIMMPLTLRQIVLAKSRGRRRKRIKKFPGGHLKHAIRLVFSKI